MIFGQIIQQVFVDEEWHRDAHKRVDAETLTHVDVEKLLGVTKQESLSYLRKLKWQTRLVQVLKPA